MSQKFVCSYCGNYHSSFGQFERHLALYHENKPGFTIECISPTCKTSFTSVCSLRRHVERNHNNFLKAWSCEMPDHDASVNKWDSFDRMEHLTESGEQTGAEEDSTCDNMQDLFMFFEKQFASFLLRCKEVHILPLIVQSEFANMIKNLVHILLTKYKNIICKYLHKHYIVFYGQDWDEIVDIERYLNVIGSLTATEYKIMSYLRRSNLITEPKEYYVDRNKHKGTFQYIPINSVLCKLLSHGDVIDSITNQEVIKADNNLHNFCDGELFKNDPYFIAYPSALQIQLYLDELELCNPLGSRRGKHKVTVIYYMIGNLPKHFRSQQKFIHLSNIVEHKFIKEAGYNYDNVLQHLLRDLQVLQTEGLEITVNGKQKNIRGKLIGVSADNLSAHTLAGFQIHFQSGRICRFCMIDHADISTCFDESQCTLRCKNNYDYHLQAVEENAANANIYGVRKACALQSLPLFDVITSFPPDIMHDLMEGVIPITIQLLLQYLRDANIISCDMFNDKLRDVKISHIENKPCLLSESVFRANGHLSGSAAQKFELFLLLPQLIGSIVDKNSKPWKVYLLLREISDIVFAPVLSNELISDVNELIAQFMHAFVETFGKNKLVPKIHYLVHYPRMMRLFGPLKNFWCMRFEAKHQYFKKVARQTACFKNISKSLAKRHQMRQCWEMLGEEMLIASNQSLSKSVSTLFSKLSEDIQIAIANCTNIDINANELVTSVKSLQLNNVKYKVNNVFVLQTVQEEHIPVVMYLKKIICVRDCWFFCGKLCFAEQFNAHLHAYKIRQDGWIACQPDAFLDYSTHDRFVIEGEEYFNMRYACFSEQLQH